jgi:serine/threonine protein kinase
MGDVWRAHHRLLIRPAAIKLIRPQPAGDPGLLHRRFEREARATAALRSPHTVQLYDFGVADDGTLYYVMELLEGLDLETLVRRFGQVPAERAVPILKQVCHSLAEAHQAGLVHRDIKPANLFITRAGGERDFVKVLDFGLVKLGQGSEAPEVLRLTATGAVAGTPAYVAPEIVLGDAHVDHRADLYALGCVGYWLLTGRLVFEGDTRMKVLVQHAQTPPPPPSTRTELSIPAPARTTDLRLSGEGPGRAPAKCGRAGTAPGWVRGAESLERRTCGEVVADARARAGAAATAGRRAPVAGGASRRAPHRTAPATLAWLGRQLALWLVADPRWRGSTEAAAPEGGTSKGAKREARARRRRARRGEPSGG